MISVFLGHFGLNQILLNLWSQVLAVIESQIIPSWNQINLLIYTEKKNNIRVELYFTPKLGNVAHTEILLSCTF